MNTKSCPHGYMADEDTPEYQKECSDCLKASLAEVKKELSRCQGEWGREQARADKLQGECLHKYPEGLCPVCWRTVTKELAELKIVKRRYQEKAGEYLDRGDRLEKELAEALAVNEAKHKALRRISADACIGCYNETDEHSDYCEKEALEMKSGSELLAKRDRETEARVLKSLAHHQDWNEDEKESARGIVERSRRIEASRQTVKGDE